MLWHRGFTLIELMVVMVIISILASVLIVNFDGANAKGRDAERQADLRNLQTAIEQYKLRYGRYPAMGCSVGSDGFSGENDCSMYITGYESGKPFTPEFINVLPRDPRRSSNPGYAYTTNDEGTVYKLMAISTVEDEIVNYEHPFASCDMSEAQYTNSSGNLALWEVCGQVISEGNNTPDRCQTNNARFQRSYGVWGGYANRTTSSSAFNAPNGVMDLTQRIICK